MVLLVRRMHPRADIPSSTQCEEISLPGTFLSPQYTDNCPEKTAKPHRCDPRTGTVTAEAAVGLCGCGAPSLAPLPCPCVPVSRCHCLAPSLHLRTLLLLRIVVGAPAVDRPGLPGAELAAGDWSAVSAGQGGVTEAHLWVPWGQAWDPAGLWLCDGT